MERQDQDAKGASFYPVHRLRKTTSWLYGPERRNAYKIFRSLDL